MRLYKLGAHTKTDLKVHLIWIPKYRKRVLTDQVAIRARDILRQIALEHELDVISGKIANDHVHMLIGYLPAIIYLGAEHGAAKQEILGLKWSKIDFDYNGNGLISLFRTKTKKERTDCLMPRTKQALLDWRDHLIWMRHRRKITEIKSDFVICHLDGSPIKNYNKAWWRSLDIAGIQDFHFHDLRHTFCSNLILSGAGLKEVKEMIGHKDIAMTDRYSHLTDEHKHIRQNRLAEHYESKN